jgi:hypothetical protein
MLYYSMVEYIEQSPIFKLTGILENLKNSNAGEDFNLPWSVHRFFLMAYPA